MLAKIARGEDEGGGDNVPVVATTSLEGWADRNNVESVVYLSLDLEGHEPLVIEGMGLEREANRRRFATFQYELGGTWGERDPRRPLFAMNQHQVSRK